MLSGDNIIIEIMSKVKHQPAGFLPSTAHQASLSHLPRKAGGKEKCDEIISVINLYCVLWSSKLLAPSIAATTATNIHFAYNMIYQSNQSHPILSSSTSPLPCWLLRRRPPLCLMRHIGKDPRPLGPRCKLWCFLKMIVMVQCLFQHFNIFNHHLPFSLLSKLTWPVVVSMNLPFFVQENSTW